MSDIIRDLQLPRCPRAHPGLPPAPTRSPTPLSSHPERGARPAPARTKLAPAAAWAPRGLHAGLGPAGSATGDRLVPALSASYLPQLGRHPRKGALWASRRTPGSPIVLAPLGSGPGGG